MIERLVVLLAAGDPGAAAGNAWNDELLAGCERALAGSDAIVALSAHVMDAEARAAAAEAAPGAASFDAVLEVGVEGPLEAALEALPEGATRHVYRVERRVVKSSDAPPGARAPGIEMISPVRRKQGISHAAFDAHWRDRHAPLALHHHVGMQDYRQNPVREVLSPGSPDWDGVAILGFGSAQDYRTRMFDSDEGRRIIFEDVDRFLDLGRSEAALLSHFPLR
jgi:uncharacterized protein (TIGR02118 family)